MKTAKRLLHCGMILIIVLGLVAVSGGKVQAAGTISLTAMGTAYTQDFNTLANTGTTNSIDVLNGWSLMESGSSTRNNKFYSADDGGSNDGDTYSYGTDDSPERALGGLQTNSLIPVYGASFTNNTGSIITMLEIAYTGEEWRLGSTGRADQLTFEFSTNAISLTSGTWTGVPALNFTTPDRATTGAKNGNASNERTQLSTTISSLNIPSGATFWIRWVDSPATGPDDGLAIDDFSLTPVGVPTATDTTVSLTTDPNPSLLGEWVTMTVAVEAVPVEAGIPTGWVQVYDNGEPFDIPAGLGVDGRVVIRTQVFTVGDHHLTAAYLGNENFHPSTSPQVLHTVQEADGPPATLSFIRQTPVESSTREDTLVFRVDFSEPVTGVDTADFTVDSVTTAMVTSVSPASSSAYDVTVSGGDLPDFNGTVGLNFSSTMNIIDLNNNAVPNNEPLLDEFYTVVNKAATTVSLITDPNPSLVGEWVNMTVTVGAVPPEAGTPTGFVQFYDHGEAYGGPTGLGVDGKVVLRTQELSAGEHHLTVAYLGNDNFNVSTSEDVLHIVGIPAPDTQIDSHPSDPNISARAEFTFSSPDLTAIFECRLDGSEFSPCLSPQEYTVANGQHTFEVQARDLAGNVDPTPASYTWTVDAAPTVVSVARQNVTPGNRTTVFFLVTFSEPVTGVNAADFTLTTTGDLNGVSIASIAGSGAARTVAVNTGSGSGSLRLDVLDDDTIQDTTGTPLDGAFSSGEEYRVDRTPPTVVSSIDLNHNPSSRGTVFFLVTFSEPVTGVSAADFSLITSGNIEGAAIDSVVGAGTTRTVAVNTGSGTGTIRLDVMDDNSIVDVMGVPLDSTFTAGQEYVIEKNAPQVVSLVRINGNPSNRIIVFFVVTFSESVTRVNAADFDLVTTGNIEGAAIVSVSGGGTIRTIGVNTGTGSGTIRLDLAVDNTIRDLARNPLGGPGNGNPITGPTYAIVR